MIKFEDITKAAHAAHEKESLLMLSRPSSIDIYHKTPNERCVGIVDVIFDKILDLMSKDTKKSGIEKRIIVSGAKGLKGSVTKYIMLELSMDGAEDILERCKKEID